MLHTSSPKLALAVFLIFFNTYAAFGIASPNPYLPGFTNLPQGAADDGESVHEADEDLARLRDITKRLEERRTEQNSPSLLSRIFSSNWGIAGIILLFFLVFSLVYFTLKKHESSRSG